MSSLFRLVSKERLEIEEILSLFQASRRIDVRYAAAADEIIPESSRYLTVDNIRNLIMAETPIENISRVISEQKKFFERSQELLSYILQYFKFKTEKNLINAIEIIDDCHHDLPFIERAKRRDKQKRELMSELVELSEISNKFINRIKLADDAVSEFIRNINTLGDRTKIDTSRHFYSEDFVQILTIFKSSIDIYRKEVLDDSSNLPISDNRVKTHIVKCAYMLCLYYDGPKLKTTPGSQFSDVCSKLFEMLSGKADESLAGAINRFSASQERSDLDENEILSDEQDAAGDYDVDNFYIINKNVSATKKTIVYYEKLYNTMSFDKETQNLIKMLIESNKDYITKIENSFGPNIVWAHHLPGTWFNDGSRLQEAQSRLIEAEIALGKLRRAMQEQC